MRSLSAAVALFALATVAPACSPVRQMQANISPPAVVGRTVWWADQRTSVYGGRERVQIIMCHEDGTPPCITFGAADADAEQMRHWIRSVQTADRNVQLAPPPGMVAAP